MNLEFSNQEIRKLLPSLFDRQKKLIQTWRNQLGPESLNDIAIAPIDTEKLNELLKSKKYFNLPDYLRIGNLTLKKEYVDKTLVESANFLKNTDIPSIINFKNKSAILNSLAFDAERMTTLLQIAVIKLLLNLDSKVVKCTVIDLTNFGDTFPLLNASIPNLEIISDSMEVDQFFRKMSDLLKDRNKKRGFSYQYIHEYNEKNEDSAEPYHFIFISSYNTDLRDEEKKLMGRLLAGENSAKAGIYFLINFNNINSFNEFSEEHPSLPKIYEEMEGGLVKYISINDPTCLDTSQGGIHKIFSVNEDKHNINYITRLTEICFEHLSNKTPSAIKISLPVEENWNNEAWNESASKGIKVPIGKSQGKLIHMALGGEEIVHNTLIGGAVGTGKTNLLHAIIIQALAKYSPTELNLSLLDYKSGTEFKDYQNIPHLYAISLGPKIKFGEDLLVHFRQELERRGDLFKKASVKDLHSYREKTGEVLARHLIVIDEFQVLFSASENAKGLLEDLIRRGRSFGFNFILSSQSLKDCSLSSPTKSNIGCRICLKLSESDCSDFLSIENIAPSRFDFKGQAIYNDKEGRSNGNVEFRVAYYTDSVISDFVKKLELIAEKNGIKKSANQFKYLEDGGLLKEDIRIERINDDLFIGYQEGIPPINMFITTDYSAGPVVCVGVGPSRVLFEKNLKDELDRIDSEKFLIIESSNLKEFFISYESGALNDKNYLILNIKNREALDMSIQNSLTNLINNAKSKLIFLIDSSKIISDHMYFLKKNSADLFICLDVKSIKDYGQLPQGYSPDESCAIFSPLNDFYPDTVLIPRLTKGA